MELLLELPEETGLRSVSVALAEQEAVRVPWSPLVKAEMEAMALVVVAVVAPEKVTRLEQAEQAAVVMLSSRYFIKLHMRYALFNRNQSSVKTFLASAKSEIPSGYELVPEDTLPAGWTLEPQEISVPVSVTPRQLRLLLHRKGLLPRVDGAIASLVGEAKAVAQIEWDYAIHYDRDNPMLVQLATAIGLTSADIDQMFVDASQL